MVELITGNPPTCTGGGSFNAAVGVPFSETVTGTDPAGGTLNFSLLNAPAGSSLSVTSGPSPATTTFNWTPTSADFGQTYPASIIVTNSLNLQATCGLGLTVPLNQAPIAEANGPYTGSKTTTTNVSAVGSSDSDGTIVLYEWDCEGDGVYEMSTTSQTATCPAFALGGSYGTWLRVTDDQGTTGTDTALTIVSNVAPTADAGGPYTTNQTAGSITAPVTIDGSGSSDGDGGALTYAWDCDTTGGASYSAPSTSPATSCTYPDDGVFTGSLQVCDPEGDCSADNFVVTVGNTAPVADAGGPYTSNQGVPVTLDGSGSSDVDGAIVLFQWDCDDSDGLSFSAGTTAATFTCTYPDDGTFTATLRVTDDDGGTGDDTASVVSTNTLPVANAGGPYTGDEGTPITLDGSASTDADGTIAGWAWDCEDDGTVDGTGATFACTYPDDGTWTARLTVTDDDGGTNSATASVTVGNLPPTLSAVTVPQPIDEGASVVFSGTATDPSPLDTFTWAWSWGDGTSDSTGASPSHTFVDEGSYTVTATVDDGDGGTDSTTETAVVLNVAPTITSSPVTTAPEGTAWVYAPVATDPGTLDVMTWSVSASAPAALTLDAATGALSWTPTYADALAGSVAFTLFVDDGDGGTDAQSISLSLEPLDADGDGMDDGWELANGLDPTDPTDATEDPDGDGVDNLGEFLAGTDPNAYGGPDVPTLISPIGGAEAVTQPDLVLGNATDPDGDPLLYTWEVYSDAALSTLVTDVDSVAEDASGQTTWKVDLPLTENTPYWWRARASDPFVDGAWSVTEDFYVNEANEPPTAPTPATPLDGELVASLSPDLQFGASTDPDGDAVTYTIEIWGDAALTSLLTSTTGLVESTGLVEWTVDVALAEDSWSWLRAKATDEHGLDGPWSTLVSFQVSSAEEAPIGLTWVEPLDGGVVGTRSPLLVATGATDPEGAAVVYEFEVADDGSWTTSWLSSALSAESDGYARWDLAEQSVELAENNDAFARVRAGDGAVWSAWEVISFFVDGEDEAPGVPVLVAPADGADIGLDRPVELIAAWTSDADRESLQYVYVVARDEALDEMVATVSIGGGNTVTDGAGEVVWPLFEALEPGTFWWSVQAVDDSGLEGGFATPWSVVVPEDEGPTEPTGDDDDDDDATQDCTCAASGSSLPAASWLLLATLVPVLRRRNRRR